MTKKNLKIKRKKRQFLVNLLQEFRKKYKNKFIKMSFLNLTLFLKTLLEVQSIALFKSVFCI